MTKRKAVFLDKDGTLLIDVPYNVDPARMQLAPAVGPTLAKLQQRGYLFIVISNQGGIAKGMFPEAAIGSMFEHLRLMLQPYNVRLEALYYCPHHPEGRVRAYAIKCDCRKPQSNLFARAIEDYHVDAERSWMIGDLRDDVEAGKRAGLRTILIDDEEKDEGPSRRPDFIVSSFSDVYNKIVERPAQALQRAAPRDRTPDLSMDTILKAIDRFGGTRILLIGDAALDRYLIGAVTRLNREAPVPIVDIKKESAAAACAANVAVNLSHLGAHVRFISILGADHDGAKLQQILARAGVDTSTIITDGKRRTLTKQRVFGGDHMYVRFDAGSTDALGKDAERLALQHLDRLYDESSGVIVSDYGYGMLTPRIIERLGQLRRGREKPLLVDAKVPEKFASLRPTVVKPNYEEARRLAHLPAIPSEDRAAAIAAQQDVLLEATGAEAVAVTLDTEGALLLQAHAQPIRLFAEPRDNTRAIGAGDTFSSALLLSLTGTLSLAEAARVAQAASTMVVRKDGTATCSNRELQFYFASKHKRIVSGTSLDILVSHYRAQGKRIVFTNGCFDILHSGHIAYLSAARKLGDVLIVGINTDESVRKLKGESRPVNTLDDRMRVLCGLSSVDHVIAFADDTASPLVAAIRPEVYVKGGDYSLTALPEARVVESYGGSVELIPMMPGKSTSSIIQKIQVARPFTHQY